MKIALVNDEIIAAITESVTKQGIETSGKDVYVDLTAGRGKSGYTATVHILPAGSPAPVKKVVKPQGKKAKAAAAATVETPADEASDATSGAAIGGVDPAMTEGNTDTLFGS